MRTAAPAFTSLRSRSCSRFPPGRPRQTRTVPPPAPPPPAPRRLPSCAPTVRYRRGRAMPRLPGRAARAGRARPSGYYATASWRARRPTENGGDERRVHRRTPICRRSWPHRPCFIMATHRLAPVNHLRLRCTASTSRAANFLVDPDTNSRHERNLSFGFTPHRTSALRRAADVEQPQHARGDDRDAGARDPDHQVLRRPRLGAKASLPVARGMTLLRLLRSCSVDLRSVGVARLDVAVAGATLHARSAALAHAPLRFHASR